MVGAGPTWNVPSLTWGRMGWLGETGRRTEEAECCFMTPLCMRDKQTKVSIVVDV